MQIIKDTDEYQYYSVIFCKLESMEGDKWESITKGEDDKGLWWHDKTSFVVECSIQAS